MEIDSKYRLGACLTAAGAEYEAYATMYRGTDAAIRLYRFGTAAEANALTGGFVLGCQLPHPNLLAIYDYGCTETHAWVVLERGDECLGEILRDRPLSEDETRQLLDGVLPPLDYLHDRLLFPGNLDATNVFACGDRIKLSADRIRAMRPESDSDQVGSLILQALTGSTDRTGVEKLHAPFRDIVGKRWDLATIKRVLAGEVVEEAGASVSEASVRVSESVTPVANAAPVLSGGALQPRYKKYAGLAIGGALAAAALCALLIRGAHNTAEPHSFDAQTIPVSAPASAVTNSPAKSESDTYPAVTPGWAIVGASFSRGEDAAKRAASLQQEHSKLEAAVYSVGNSSAGSKHDRFVVLFASGLTEAQAKKQLTRIRRAGAPRGTYITRFK